MLDKLFVRAAKDTETGRNHIFEVYQQSIPNVAPYVIMLDGAFYGTMSGMPRVMREIHRVAEWFGWQKPVPVITH